MHLLGARIANEILFCTELLLYYYRYNETSITN
jgi:hypothetical protein